MEWLGHHAPEQCGGDTSSPGDATKGGGEVHRKEGGEEAPAPTHIPGNPGEGEGAATKPVAAEVGVWGGG